MSGGNPMNSLTYSTATTLPTPSLMLSRNRIPHFKCRLPSLSMLVTPSLLVSIHQLANLFQEG